MNAVDSQLSSEETALKAQLLEMMREATARRGGDDPYWAISTGAATAATAPTAAPKTGNVIAVEPAAPPAHPRFREAEQAADNFVAPTAAGSPADEFVPLEPKSLGEAGLSETEVEALILKYLINCGSVTGRTIAEQIRLPFKIIERLLAQMKLERLVVYRGGAAMNDYQYELTDIGNDRARRCAQHCTYFGAAPVSLEDYIRAVHAQTLTTKKPSHADLQRAFAELVLSEQMMSQLGQALHAGRGLFLYGSPGNGKTSIAQRVTAAYGETLWIPRCISVFGEIVRLYDPSNHCESPLPDPPTIVNDQPVDQRWIRIRRPTIVVGGELTLESLEIKTNTNTGIGEAPLQMKSNGGTLVIDDFGRQRVSADELLNRWIVPLETGYDYLNLASGRKIQVPFDQLIVFSTNLEPAALVDEAFLRRIPYKLDVQDPTEAQFRALLSLTAGSMNIACPDEMIEYLLDKHYKHTGRPLRFCHPRDLLRQVANFCSFHEAPRVVTRQNIDAAVKNYFAAISLVG